MKKKKKKEQDLDAVIGKYLLICAAAFLIAVVLASFRLAEANRRVDEAKRLIENGQVVTGTISGQKGFGIFSRADLSFEANGKDWCIETKAAFQAKESAAMRKGGHIEADIYYDGQDPSRAACAETLTLAKGARQNNITLICIFGLFAVGTGLLGVGTAVANSMTEKRHQQVEEIRGSANTNYDSFRRKLIEKAEEAASCPLAGELEEQAQQVYLVFKNCENAAERGQRLSQIGSVINNDANQIKVAYRSAFLAQQEGLEFSHEELALAWKGAGGW